MFGLRRWDGLWFRGSEDLVKVLCGILDPLLFGVSAQIFAQLGLEAVEKSKTQSGYSEISLLSSSNPPRSFAKGCRGRCGTNGQRKGGIPVSASVLEGPVNLSFSLGPEGSDVARKRIQARELGGTQYIVM